MVLRARARGRGMADLGLWVGSDGVFGDTALRRSEGHYQPRMGRVEHLHKSSSVIVLVVNQDYIFPLKRKRQSPIPIHLDGPVSR